MERLPVDFWFTTSQRGSAFPAAWCDTWPKLELCERTRLEKKYGNLQRLTLMSSERAEKLTVCDEHSQWRSRWRAREVLPLYYRKRTRSNGQSDEVSLGPCAVCLFRWAIVLILGIGLIALGDEGRSFLVRIFLRILP